MSAESALLESTEELDYPVLSELVEQKSGDEEEVGDEGGLQDDGHVTCVEQFDAVRSSMALGFLVVDGNVDIEALEEVDDEEDEDSSDDRVQVGQLVSVEGELEGFELALFGPQIMEQSDEGAFVLVVEFGWTEGFPEEFFAHIGSNEQRNG